MEIEKAMRVASPQGSGKFVLCVDLNGLGMRDLNPVTATTSASFILNHYPGCIGQVRRQLCTAKNRLLTPYFRTARTPPPPSLNHSHHNRVWSTQQVCLLDVGITFRALWSVISPMLDTHTSEKVAMLKGEAMHKYFGEHFTIPQAAFMAQVMGMKPVPGSLPRELMAELGQPFDERA